MCVHATCGQKTISAVLFCVPLFAAYCRTEIYTDDVHTCTRLASLRERETRAYNCVLKHPHPVHNLANSTLGSKDYSFPYNSLCSILRNTQNESLAVLVAVITQATTICRVQYFLRFFFPSLPWSTAF